MTTKTTTISGRTIQHDASGVGHAWRTVDADSLPANVAEEIAAEILDGGRGECDDYVASNGQHYRWQCDYLPCCHCDGTGTIEAEGQEPCECSACDGTGDAQDD